MNRKSFPLNVKVDNLHASEFFNRMVILEGSIAFLPLWVMVLLSPVALLHLLDLISNGQFTGLIVSQSSGCFSMS